MKKQCCSDTIHCPHIKRMELSIKLAKAQIAELKETVQLFNEETLKVLEQVVQIKEQNKIKQEQNNNYNNYSDPFEMD